MCTHMLSYQGLYLKLLIIKFFFFLIDLEGFLVVFN